MPELHQDPSAAPAMPQPLPQAAGWPDDADFALGCECAVPALQIDAWREQAGAGSEPGRQNW